ncbi:MAG: ABC transporter ATP-binding protein [Ruminococcus sp.]|nr:ABC transporter ATP-binding protein [Ruminococcus sp.]
MGEIVRAEGISKEFIRESRGTNRFVAVKQTDLTLSSGELTVIRGRSGSGKSTLLNMLAGLTTPTSGRVLIDGMDIYTLPDKELSELRNRKTGVIPQGQSAIYSLTVMENILLPYTLYGKADEGAEGYAEKLLEELGIAQLRNVMPGELSGGELRRMAIARALIRRPELILADEPTGDLDDENTEVVFNVLKNAAAGENGTPAAVLVITHENNAENYADNLLRMNAGQLLTDEN